MNALPRVVLAPIFMLWLGLGIWSKVALGVLHTSVGFAVIGAVVGEYLGSAAGLGHLIQQAEDNLDTTGVFAGMVILAVFVLAIDWLVTLAERRLLVWRPPSAAGQG